MAQEYDEPTWLCVLLIEDYIDKYLPTPSIHWPPYMFRARSSARWSAYEIMKRLNSRPCQSAVTVINEFVDAIDEAISSDPCCDFTEQLAIAKMTAISIQDEII